MILLDTNAVYWAILDDPRLGAQARELVVSSRRYVSSLTHVEFAIKAMQGKLHVPTNMPDLLAGLGFESLPFTERHSQRVRDFPALASHDPFDRMLLAQAKCDGLDFLTADRRLLVFANTVDATR